MERGKSIATGSGGPGYVRGEDRPPDKGVPRGRQADRVGGPGIPEDRARPVRTNWRRACVRVHYLPMKKAPGAKGQEAAVTVVPSLGEETR